jgi:hypothetical protein
MLIPQLLTFSLATWFGTYLLARDIRKPGLRYTGLGLLAYSLDIALIIFQVAVPPVLFAILPAVFWIGAIWPLLPNKVHSNLPRRPVTLAFLATLFFTIGIVLLVAPPTWFSTDFVLLALGFDFALLGYAIVFLDAYDEGQTLLPDLMRSFGLSFFTVLLFSLQILAIAAISGVGLDLPLRLILLTTITTAILIQTFSDTIQSQLDRIVFARMPRLRQARADLRAAANAVTRLDDILDLTALDEAEFARLTRRALSHMGDLSRLAANPLTRLPAIDSRLAAKGRPDNTLERAAELKLLLTESILHLKPQGKGDFGTTDEWRYYNALYFPYVAGLKPYSRRDVQDGIDSTTQAALDWFATYVPERTLHNWQNAAARLVAQHLREMK